MGEIGAYAIKSLGFSSLCPARHDPCERAKLLQTYGFGAVRGLYARRQQPILDIRCRPLERRTKHLAALIEGAGDDALQYLGVSGETRLG